MDKHLHRQVDALALNAGALMRLIGGSDADRQRFFERLKGITTPAVWKIIEKQFDTAAVQVKGALEAVQTLEANARELARDSAVRAA